MISLKSGSGLDSTCSQVEACAQDQSTADQPRATTSNGQSHGGHAKRLRTGSMHLIDLQGHTIFEDTGRILQWCHHLGVRPAPEIGGGAVTGRRQACKGGGLKARQTPNHMCCVRVRQAPERTCTTSSRANYPMHTSSPPAGSIRRNKKALDLPRWWSVRHMCRLPTPP